jgi:hypothetical protein
MSEEKDRAEEDRAQTEEMKVVSWNSLFDIGQTVIITKDDGSQIATTTRAKAELVGGTAVCWFKDISGAYMLDRARPI